jgi:hypothetical protein
MLFEGINHIEFHGANVVSTSEACMAAILLLLVVGK